MSLVWIHVWHITLFTSPKVSGFLSEKCHFKWLITTTHYTVPLTTYQAYSPLDLTNETLRELPLALLNYEPPTCLTIKNS